MIRALRLLRVFRVFKIVRYVSEVTALVNAIRATRTKIAVFLAAVLTVVLSERAFQAYQAGRFDEAGELLAEQAALWPGDRSIELLHALYLQFSSEPPPLGWDGVARLDSK